MEEREGRCTAAFCRTKTWGRTMNCGSGASGGSN